MNQIEKRINNEANVHRHFKVTQRVVDEQVPAWVRKAQAGFKSNVPNIPRDIEWAKKSVKVPAKLRIP